MAKISAYGEHKIAEARLHQPAGTYPGTDIPHRACDHVLVLTSGGRILHRCRIDGHYQSSGYTVRAKVKKGADKLATFRTYAERRGYTMTIERF